MDSTQQHAAYQQWANGQWIEFIYSNPENDDYLYRLINHIVKA